MNSETKEIVNALKSINQTLTTISRDIHQIRYNLDKVVNSMNESEKDHGGSDISSEQVYPTDVRINSRVDPANLSPNLWPARYMSNDGNN